MSGLYESLSGAAGARAEGHSARNIANYNAAVAEQQGKAALLRSAYEQQQQAKRAERVKSASVANLGAAGALGSPVAFDITQLQANELELENLLIGYEGETAAARAKSQATADRLQGQLYHLKGHNAARAANVQFALQLASFAPFIGGGGNPPHSAGISNVGSTYGAGGYGFAPNMTTGMGF